MSKYSSYKEHQLITENWREFTSEGETTVTEEDVTADDLAHLAKRPAHGKTEADMIEEVLKAVAASHAAWQELKDDILLEAEEAGHSVSSPRMRRIRAVSEKLVNLGIKAQRLTSELQGLTPLPYTPKARD